MKSRFQSRTEELQRRLKDAGHDVALLSDMGSIYYYTGYHSYHYMDFGRPTIVVIPVNADVSIVTPELETEMCRSMSWVDDVRPWLDGFDGEWGAALAKLLSPFNDRKIGIEHFAIPPAVRDFLNACRFNSIEDISHHVSAMRMIKDSMEIQVARDGGKVAVAMVEAARDTIAEGVPEYEVVLAAVNAGTRKAAELSNKYSDDPLMSPTIHFHQVMSSGQHVSMTHRRSSGRAMEEYDPIFLCYCGHAEFRQFKMGFDRMFFINDVKDEYKKPYELAVRSQKAGIDTMRPGITAEEVHAAYVDVIRSAGFEYPYRHGRAVGYNFQESPQLKFGDKTILQPGMIFAVDGGVTLPGVFRSQVGDTVLVTETGCEVLTPYPKEIDTTVL